MWPISKRPSDLYDKSPALPRPYRPSIQAMVVIVFVWKTGRLHLRLPSLQSRDGGVSRMTTRVPFFFFPSAATSLSPAFLFYCLSLSHTNTHIHTISPILLPPLSGGPHRLPFGPFFDARECHFLKNRLTGSVNKCVGFSCCGLLAPSSPALSPHPLPLPYRVRAGC